MASATATDLRATSVYLIELENRAKAIRLGIHYMSQVNDSQEATSAAHTVLRTVEAQIAQEQDKLDRYAYPEPSAKRLSPCYCDYAFHKNGC